MLTMIGLTAIGKLIAGVVWLAVVFVFTNKEERGI